LRFILLLALLPSVRFNVMTHLFMPAIGEAGSVPASSVAAPSRGELVDDVVAAVDVKGPAGDQARCVVREERVAMPTSSM